MRLLYLGSSDFPQPKARAIQIIHTCHALARAGAEVTLVVGRRNRARPERALAAYGLAPHQRLRLVTVPIIRLPPSSPPVVLRQFTRLWQASYLLGLAVILPRELLARRPDVVYARDPRTARLAASPAHAAGAWLGFEVHGLPSVEARERALRSGLPPSEASRLRRLEAAVFARADRIITITECGRRLLLDEYGVAPERVRTIPDAAAPSSSGDESGAAAPHVATGASAPGGFRRDNGPAMPPHEADARPAVYYVGQLYPWKGAGLVVQAAALVPGARFVVVGGLPTPDGSDPDVRELAARAQSLGIAERVRFRGYVPYGRVQGELVGAAAAILPLPDEPVARCFTSPLKLFDYMAAGVPIVASDLPAIREILKDGRNALLVPPGDARALASGIERLLREPALARRLAGQARCDAAAHTWDARAERLLKFLAETQPVTDCAPGTRG